MGVWIALLRGINVGGHRKLRMKDLVGELEKLGFTDVRTYIQSGNAVFRSKSKKAPALADGIARSKLAARVERCLGVPATARNLRSVNKILELAQPGRHSGG